MTGFRPVDHRDVVGGGTPGLGLTGLDVAAALAMGGADRAATLMVLHKWVQDKSVQEPLFYAVYDAVVTVAAREHWKVPKGGEILRSITRLAIAEETDPKRCPACQGRAEALIGGVMKKCPACNGIGWSEWPEAMRARLVGIDKANWSRTWDVRYRKAREVVARFERRGLAALRNGLE